MFFSPLEFGCRPCVESTSSCIHFNVAVQCLLNIKIFQCVISSGSIFLFAVWPAESGIRLATQPWSGRGALGHDGSVGTYSLKKSTDPETRASVFSSSLQDTWMHCRMSRRKGPGKSGRKACQSQLTGLAGSGGAIMDNILGKSGHTTGSDGISQADVMWEKLHFYRDHPGYYQC